MNVTTKLVVSFIFGAVAGGLGGYYLGKESELKKFNDDLDGMERYYKDTIEGLKAELKKYEEETNEENKELSEVPIDPLDRVVTPDDSFTDYATITADYWGDAEVKAESEEVIETPIKKKESKEDKENSEVVIEDIPKKKKKRHKLPVESISEEEFHDLCMQDVYSVKQYYLDGDLWTRLNSDNTRDDISVDDFPIPLEDFNFTKGGIACFVNHEAKQLYKFHNEFAY